MCLHLYSVRTWYSACTCVNGTVHVHTKRAQCTHMRTVRTRREINTYMRTVFCLAKCDRGWCLRRFPSTAQWQRAKARDWPCSCPTCKQPTPPSAGCAPLASNGLFPPSRGGFGSTCQKKLTEIFIGKITKNPEVRHFIFFVISDNAGEGGERTGPGADAGTKGAEDA